MQGGGQVTETAPWRTAKGPYVHLVGDDDDAHKVDASAKHELGDEVRVGVLRLRWAHSSVSKNSEEPPHKSMPTLVLADRPTDRTPHLPRQHFIADHTEGGARSGHRVRGGRHGEAEAGPTRERSSEAEAAASGVEHSFVPMRRHP
jgi:hypothetical protein